MSTDQRLDYYIVLNLATQVFSAHQNVSICIGWTAHEIELSSLHAVFACSVCLHTTWLAQTR